MNVSTVIVRARLGKNAHIVLLVGSDTLANVKHKAALCSRRPDADGGWTPQPQEAKVHCERCVERNERRIKNANLAAYHGDPDGDVAGCDHA